MCYEINISVACLLDNFFNFFGNIFCLSLYVQSRKCNLLFFHVEEVGIYTSLSFYKLWCLHSVIEDTVCDRLELHYVSFISNYEKEDKFVCLFLRVFTCARVVDVVNAIGFRIPIILILLRFDIYVL